MRESRKIQWNRWDYLTTERFHLRLDPIPLTLFGLAIAASPAKRFVELHKALVLVAASWPGSVGR